jgi:MFS family permease
VNKSTQVTTADPGIGLAVVLGLMAGICSLLSAGAAVVLPKLATDIDISTTLSVWVISGFSLAYGVTMAAYGRIADLVGLRLPLTIGTIVMSVGALIAALASNFGILMVGRVLQGLGGAAVPVLGVAIVTSFNDHKLKTTGLALVTGLSSAGAGIGPLVGGLLEYVGTWRLSIGITACNAILLALIWKQIPHKKSDAKFDLVGSLLFTGVAAGLVAIIQSVSTGMTVRVIGATLLTCHSSGTSNLG